MNKYEYDYLLVGAGLFNAVIANEASKEGKKCLVIEKRPHIGGNLYCENTEGILVHKYGPHIFHTKYQDIWEYMQELGEFNHFVHCPLAFYKNKLYNLPFNMNTFYQLWGTRLPAEAMKKIESQRLQIDNPQNFEEQALCLVGNDIYNKLIKGYTEKQWGTYAVNLPASIIKRIPVRFTFNNNYFNDPYQGIPKNGYNTLLDRCFQKCEVILNIDFNNHREIARKAEKTIHTGTIDQYYNYCFGELEYRSLKFESEILEIPNYQGNAIINFTEKEIPYTRILEHKHFDRNNQSDKTVITREYPANRNREMDPYYPVNTEKNNELYKKYLQKSTLNDNIIFAGRLGSYSYYDMDRTVMEAISLYKKLSQKTSEG